MKVCILFASPRPNGNTSKLLAPFAEQLALQGAQYELVSLYKKKIASCTACRTCQKDWARFGCRIRDDVQDIFDRVLDADVIILATPIYSWYCTPPMKALLDRLVYGMNKYYGDEKGPSLWKGKRVALVTTCGYHPEKGADLLEEGIRRYCRHSQLDYVGMLAERDPGYDTEFMSEEKAAHARAFARRLVDGPGT